MSRHERVSILALINSLPQRKIAVEIGSYTGGFLRQLVKHFDKVISVDLTHQHLDKKDYSNVTFHTGDSTKVLPALIPTLTDVSFFLIDGNHEYEYVKKDLANVLTYSPTTTTYVLIHDSWYIPSRRAILDTPMTKHVHFIDLDFCYGEWVGIKWMGGLALLQLLPQERTEPLQIRSSRPYLPPGIPLPR
jgi:hypothetical protein